MKIVWKALQHKHKV